MNESNIRIMVVEDNTIYRHAIASSLDNQPDFSCVAEAASADDAIHWLQHSESPRT